MHCFYRFEDDELGVKRPATADAAMTGADDDWLGLASDKQKKRPLGLAATTDFSSGALDDDWLNMASSRYIRCELVALLESEILLHSYSLKLYDLPAHSCNFGWKGSLLKLYQFTIQHF